MKKHVIILALLFIFSSGAKTQNNPISIEKAASSGMIDLLITCKGGHVGDVITLTAKNISQAPLSLVVEAGRRLDSENDDEQDILVNRQQIFSLNKGESKSISVSGYCCQAHKGSPSQNGFYRVGKMAAEKLVKLANFIDGKKYHSSNIAQSAVWVISDSNPVNSIWNESDTVQSKILTKYVCSLLNRPVPLHPKLPALDYVEPPQKIKKDFKGEISYSVTQQCKVMVAIYDKDGNVFTVLEAERSIPPGDYYLDYELGLLGSAGDKYFVRVKINGQIKKEVELKF